MKHEREPAADQSRAEEAPELMRVPDDNARATPSKRREIMIGEMRNARNSNA